MENDQEMNSVVVDIEVKGENRNQKMQNHAKLMQIFFIFR
jgi:hypothetical protein